MIKNMSSTDRIIRVILTVVFSVLYFTGAIPAMIGLILFILGIVFLLTSLVGFCPLYKIFGLSTCDLSIPKKNA